MVIISGNSNPTLAQKIAKITGHHLAKVSLSQFPNEEIRVRIEEDLQDQEVIILQSLSIPVNANLVEFCLLCDAARRSGAKKIKALVPYFAYGKQDKVFRDGEPLSVKVIVQMIETAPFDEIITIDLHNQAIVGFFEKPIHHLTAENLFVDYFKNLSETEKIVVAPDEGGIKRSNLLSQQIGSEVAYIDKLRDLQSGEVTIHGISKSVTGKTCIIFDDMILTGATVIKTAQYLKDQGTAKVIMGVTHHLFVPGVQEKIANSAIDELVVTDSIACPENEKSDKLKVLSIIPLVSKYLA